MKTPATKGFRTSFMMHGFFMLMILSFPSVFAQSISGSTWVAANTTEEYTIDYDVWPVTANWVTANGYGSSAWQTGITFHVNIFWTTPGSTTLEFYNDGILVASLPITVNPGIELPTSSVGTRCGTGTVTLNATPGSGGNTCKWYWEDNPSAHISTGTSFETPSLGPGNYLYFVSSYNTSTFAESGRIGVTVIVKQIPTVGASPTSQSICNGQGMSAIGITNPNGVSGTSFSWTVSAPNISGASSGTGSSISQSLSQGTNANQTATYTIIATANGCSSTTPATSTVTLKPIPNAGVSLSSQSICSGQAMTSVSITNPNGVSGTTFSWTVSAPNISGASNGSGTSIAQTLTNTTNTNQTATYTITPTANGCSGTPVTHTVTVKPIPSVSATPASQSICNGQATTAISISNPNGVSGTTFSWTVSAPNISGASSGSGTSISQSLTQTTSSNQTATYTVTALANGCSSITSPTVTVKPVPNAAVSISAQSICSGQLMTSVGLSNPNGVSGTTPSWTVSAPNITGASNGSGTSIAQTLTNSTNTNQTATYTVTASSNGCTGVGVNHTVTVKPVPTVSATPASQSICNGQPMTAIAITNPNGVSGTIFSWTVSAPNISGASSGSGSSISQSLTQTTNTNQTATYTVTALANGCSSVTSPTVTVKPIPTAAVSSPTQTTCSGQLMSSVTITNPNGVSGTTFSWTVSAPNLSGASAGSGSSIAQALSNATTSNQTAVYTITPSAAGCSGTPVTHTVTVKPVPNAAVSIESQTVTSGQPMTPVVISNPNGLAGTTFSWTVSAPGITGASSGSGTSIAQALMNVSSSDQTATYTITPSANGCAGPSVYAYVTVDFLNCVSGHPINGNQSVETSWTVEYTIDYDVVLASPHFATSNGAVTQLPRQGITYRASVLWNTVGQTALEFYDGSILIGSICVQVAQGLALPSSSVVSRCGPGPITLTATPGNGGNICKWYWADDPGSFIPGGETNSLEIAELPGTTLYYVSTYNTTTQQESGRIGVTAIMKQVPTVSASPVSQARCTGLAMTPISISNPNSVPGTTFSWTVSAPDISGALPGSGNLISQTLTNETGTTKTATYSIIATANGCPSPPLVATVDVTPPPSAAVSASTQNICSGQPMTTVNITNPNAVSGTTFVWTVSAPNISGASSGSGTSITQTLLNTTTSDKVATYTITASANGCSGTPVTHSVTVRPGPDAAVSSATQAVYSGNPMTPVLLSNPNGMAGTTFSWTVSAPNITGASAGSGTTISQTLTNTTTSPQTATYTVTATAANGCSGPPAYTSVTVNFLDCLSGHPINGNQSVETSWTEEYSIDYDAVLTDPHFVTSHGAVTQLPKIGITYRASILWNTVGQAGVEFYDGSILIGSFCVTIGQGLPLPTSSVVSRCGPGPITIEATPGIGGDVCKWYWENNASAYISTGNTLEIENLPGTTIYYVSTFNSTTSQESGRIGVTAIMKQLPTTAVSPATQSLCSGGPITTITITNPNNVPGTTFSWTASAPNISGASGGAGTSILQTLTNLSQADQTATYTVTAAADGCVGPPVNATVTVKPRPVLSSSLNPPAVSSLVYYVPTSDVPGTSFTWSRAQVNAVLPPTSNGTGTINETLENYNTTTVSVVYQFQGVANLCWGPMQNVTFQLERMPYPNENYIITNASQIAGITDAGVLQSSPKEEHSQSIQYFDGLGRPMQNVTTQGSPTGIDLAQPIIYDDKGREPVAYLPFAAGNDGWYKYDFVTRENANYTTAGNPQYQFYQNTPKVSTDTRPYSETIIEASPLGRPLRDYGPGESWAPAPVGNDKFIEHQYLSNVHGTAAGQEKIIAWNINVSGMPVRGSVLPNYILTGGYYNSSLLSIKSTKDEQGNEVREYTNKIGKVILKKVQAVATPTLSNRDHWTQTYYIYDDLGNLRFVFQPELSRKIHQNDTYVPNATDLANMAFQYNYDARNRMTEKTIPGAIVTYMVYDNRDRLVLTQDGNQRAGAVTSIKYWSFTKYDELNRVVMTGIKDTTTTTALTQAAMQGVVDAHYAKSWTRLFETYVGNVAGNVHGYSNKSYPIVNKAATLDLNQYLTVNYYDNYAFKSLIGTAYNYVNEDLSATQNGITYAQPDTEFKWLAGLVTGAKVKVLDGGVAGGQVWLNTVSYFDDLQRMVQIITDNYSGGRERTTNVLDFTGKVLKTRTSHHVVWKERSGVAVFADKLVRTQASNAWNTGAATSHQLAAGQDGWLEVTVSEINTNRMIGFADTNPDLNYTSIDYALYLNSANLYVYESNINRGQKGNIATGDVLRAERTGTTVRYYKNGVVVYTSTVPSSTVLMVDASLNTSGCTITGIKTSFSPVMRTITRRFEYDHAGRLLDTWHSIDAAPELLLAKNEYNELGQLVDKKLHSTDGTAFKQSVDHRYNIRGWLTSINNSALVAGPDNDETNDLFGMQLGYNNDLGTGNSSLFNGNISAAKWSAHLGLGDVKERAYNYNYDQLNRITAAAYQERTAVWNTPSGSAFSESGYGYDQNGNISGFTRKGVAGANMDILTYTYTAGSNKLIKVADAGDLYTGFKDGVNITTEYTYDNNGNVITDQNKGITAAITYNFLNLPLTVNRGANTVTYIYDATGRKLSQLATFFSSVKRTDYIGEFQYENDALQFISNEEGRTVFANTKTIYQNNAESTVEMTAFNSTLAQVTQNGTEKYVRVTSNGTVAETGIFPIGGVINVQPGEKYRIRAKGYRTGTSNAYIQVKVNGTNLNFMTAALPASVATEAWTEQQVTIMPGITTMQVGMVWGTVTAAQQFFLNEFEVIKLTTQAPEYQYNLEDHLGNVRLTFTTKDEQEEDVAALEDANIAMERSKFLRYDNAKRVSASVFDHTNGAATGYAQRLNGGANETYGLAKSISVMPGDVINMEVYAKFVDQNPSNWTTAFNTLLGQIAANQAGVVVDGTAYSSSTSSFPFAGYQNTSGSTGTGPKAYLNWLVFDRNYVFKNAGYQRLSDGPREYGQDVAHELLSASVTITEPGYVYIYLSNEETSPVEVYFDDFKVTHTKSPVIQMDDYYPFGLTFNSYSRENLVNQGYLYNGKELQDELDLGWYDYQARQYDPAIGRWMAIDPLSEVSRRVTPYAYCYNNPIRFVDPDGMLVEDPYLLFNGKEKSLEIWDDNDTPDDYDDDYLIASGDAKNDVVSNSNGKWEDGEYDMLDKSEPKKHGDDMIGGQLADSDNGAYGSEGIYRAVNFDETTTDLTRTGMGVHAGRENKDWDTERKTNGCIRVKPETFDDITDAIATNGDLTKIIVQENRQSDNSSTVKKINPGANTRIAETNAQIMYEQDVLGITF